MNKLHADSIVKHFGNLRVLSDVSIHCEPGEIVGIMGRNGCGKSTLMKIIFGSLSADNKFVRADLKHINNVADSAGRISYLPQDHFLPGHLKLKNIISLFCREQDRMVLLKNPMIQPFLNNKKVKYYSGGEKRLLEILLVLHSGAKYLLLDEPFNGLSPIYVEAIKSTIQNLKQKGIIITDHDYRNVLDVVDRIILISNGSTRQINDYDDLRLYGYLPYSE